MIDPVHINHPGFAGRKIDPGDGGIVEDEPQLILLPQDCIFVILGLDAFRAWFGRSVAHVEKRRQEMIVKSAMTDHRDPIVIAAVPAEQLMDEPPGALAPHRARFVWPVPPAIVFEPIWQD